ncbi:MAG: DNA-binding domain-containing protein [Methylohalobius sp.]|nr:DNA-binding domain-containing protein [Methylohalobius sp.]
MKLTEIQHRLQAAILDQAQNVPPFLAGDGAKGLAVYREAYRLRLLEALVADYPVLYRWLGEETFAELALAYLAAFPSCERSLRWIGKHLAEFLQSTDPWRARPELSEMALFEWTLGLAFDCADSDPLFSENLAQIPSQQWPKLKFKLHPSVYILALRYPVPQIWRAMQDAMPLPDCQKLQSTVSWLIWRKELRVFFRSLAKPERLALEAIQASKVFSEVCAGLAEWDCAADVAGYMAYLLRRWLEEGLIVAVAA